MTTQAVVRTDTEALRRSNEPSVDTGQATAGGAATLTDAAKTWMVNEWATKVVEITEGAGKGQFRNIVSNTATILTVAPAWTVVPDNTSYYRIGLVTSAGGGGSTLDSGVSTGGGAAALIDALRGWDIGVWEGKIIKITSGAASGDIRKIISNTATQVNVANNFTAAIVAGVNYEIMDDNAVPADVRRSTTSTLVPLAKQMDEGIVTTAGAGVVTVTDVNKNLRVDIYAGCMLRVVSGTGAGSVRRIVSNTAGAGTVYTVDAVITTGTDSKYIIYSLPLTDATGMLQVDVLATIDEGTAAAGAGPATISDAGKKWETDALIGNIVRIISGTGIRQLRIIIANTATTITVSQPWTTGPAAGDNFVVLALKPGSISDSYATPLFANASVDIFAARLGELSNKITGIVKSDAESAGLGLLVKQSTSAAGQGDAWDQMANSGVIPGNGCCGLYPGWGDYIYALDGDTGTGLVFRRYSISGNTWSLLAVAPGVITTGSAMAYPGAGTLIYVLQGSSNVFWAYDIATNTWSAPLAVSPAVTGAGCKLSASSNTDVLIGFRGANTSDVWSYTISIDTWAVMASPAIGPINAGSALCYPGSGDLIYAFQGAATSFWSYTISTDTWNVLPIALAATGSGASLVYPGSGNAIYATRGGGNTTVWRYAISATNWAVMTPIPVGITTDGFMVWSGVGDYIFASIGAGPWADFWRYTVEVWDYVTRYSVVGGTVLVFSVDIAGKFVKVSYTNGHVAQTYFRASISLK